MSGRVATATVLFTDLAGSTAQRVALGDDAADELVALHDRLLGEAIVGYRGRVIKSTGDGVMAVFAAAADAVGAGVAIQQAAERHNRGGDERHRLSIRIGVSAGDVQFVSEDCQGIPVVEAARLEAASTPDEIWVSDLVRSIVGSRRGYAFELVGDLDLKGLGHSLTVHRVLWEPRPDDAEVRGRGAPAFAVPLPSRLDVHSPFVGRQRERERLDTSLADVGAEGCRRVVLIAGEPGIGKTALTAQFARAAHGGGAAVLYGRCGEDLGVAYQPWVEVLGSLVEHAPTELLADHVSVRGGEIARLVPELATRVHAPVMGSTDPEAQRSLVFNAIVDVLRRASMAAPVVLVLDDLHWADTPSLQLLRHVVAAETPARMLVVGTYRESEVGDALAKTLAALAREPDVERVQLRGLDFDTLGELFSVIIGGELGEAGLGLRGALLAETDGNPFFVVEILRHLSETGAIYRDEDSGRWVSTELREQGLPVSVREVIGRRVARLGEATRRALGYASVIGRDFDLEVLADLMDCDADAMLDLLEPALEHTVVLDVAPGRFSFAHALIEHALYDQLSPTRRARAHGLVAAVLEARLGDDPGARSGELAYHWALATTSQDTSKAIGYAIGAGDFALAQLAPDEARRWYCRALELLEQCHLDGSKGADGPDARAAALVGLGDAQNQLGDPQYRATLIEAGQLAAGLGDTDLLVRAALATNSGMGTEVGGFAADVVAVIQAALGATEAEVSSRRAKLVAVLATEHQAVNTSEACELAGQAIELARLVGDDATLCWVASRVEFARSSPETLAKRVQFNREVLSIARRLGDPVLLFSTAVGGRHALFEAGELDEADSLSALANELGERIGQPGMQWVNAFCDATRAMLAGTLEVAEAQATRAVEIGSARTPMAFATYGGQIMQVRMMQGRDAEIIERLAQTVADNRGLATVRALAAAVYARLGRTSEATEVVAADLADDFRSYPFDYNWTTSMCMLAQAVSDLELRDPAAVLYTRLTPFAAQLPYAGPSVWEVGHHSLGRLATVLGRYDDADAHFHAAADTHQRIQAPYLLASTRIAWAEMLARRAHGGDPNQARDLAKQAATVATQSGYSGIERRAQTLLAQLS